MSNLSASSEVESRLLAKIVQIESYYVLSLVVMGLIGNTLTFFMLLAESSPKNRYIKYKNVNCFCFAQS